MSELTLYPQNDGTTLPKHRHKFNSENFAQLLHVKTKRYLQVKQQQVNYERASGA